MYEEDRLEALDLYDDLFEKCTNEQGLLQLLSSPTRQAVVIARAYGGRERKLDINSQRKGGIDEDNNGTPDFVEAIFKVRHCAEDAGLLSAIDEAEDTPAEEAPVVENDEEAVEEAAEAEEKAEDFEEAAAEPESEAAAAPAESEAETEADVSDEAEEKTEAENEIRVTEESLDAQAKEINDFLNSFSIEKPEIVPEVSKEEPVVELVTEEAEAKEVVTKTNVLVLIPYLIVFIPLGLIAICILLLLSLSVIAVAAGVGFGGAILISTLAGSFGMFADALVVAGIALIALALALLLLWTAIWLIGGACVGVFKGIVSLGKKCCVKEVSAE